MSLELFINSGSITEIDLSKIDGVRFEDAFSVSSITCATLYYNVQDFTIPPLTPVGVLNIPETNYFMFDENTASDWNTVTPTKIRISLKALGRILDRTAYQQKLFDIIKNRRVDSEITLTKLPTLNDSDPKSLKKFKITEANYLERTYDDSGQKFYSLEWGGTDLTETADFTGLFDYLPSSEDRKDGFFTLTVEQIDSEVNNDEPPSQGDELLICIKPSAKYGFLDVVDSTFDTITVDNIIITSASVDSLIVNGDIKFLDTGSIEKIVLGVANQRMERKFYTKPEYVEIPKWANEVQVICIGGGGGGGAGVDLNDAHFTIGGSGGSGGTMSVRDMFKQVVDSIYYTDVVRDADGVIIEYTPRPQKELDWVLYVNPGAGGRGGTVYNSLLISDEQDALEKFITVWNSYYGSKHRDIVASELSEEGKYGARPRFYGLNIDYAYSLIIGDLSTKYKEEPITPYYSGITKADNIELNPKDRSIRFYEVADRFTWHWTKRKYMYWFNDMFVKLNANSNPSVVDNKGVSQFLLVDAQDGSSPYTPNLRKMYKSRAGSNGSPSYATLIHFTNINKELDPVKKAELLRERFEMSKNDEAKAAVNIWAAGGSGGEGGTAIKYSTKIKNEYRFYDWSSRNALDQNVKYWRPIERPSTVINFEITPFGRDWKRHWAIRGYNGALFVLKNDTAPSNLRHDSSVSTGQAYTKLYNPIPFMESAATETAMLNENLPSNSIYISDPWAQWSGYMYNLALVFSDMSYTKPAHTEFRGGHGGYGVVEPLHYDSVMVLKSNRNRLWGLEGDNWKLPSSVWYYDQDTNLPSRRGKPADYYLNSSPNASQAWITETSPSIFFMWNDAKDLFTRVNRWIYDFSSIDLTSDEYKNNYQNVIQILNKLPRLRTPYTRPRDKGSMQTYETGITGGGGGTGWAGFDPIGMSIPTALFEGTSEEPTLIDIMDMSKEYLAELKAKSLQGIDDGTDFLWVNFYNYANQQHIRVGKGGTHKKPTVGLSNYHIGGDGGNAIRRWVVEYDGLSQSENRRYNIKTVLEPSSPSSDSSKDPNVIRYGAGGGAGGSGGIDIGSVDPEHVLVDTLELNQRTTVSIPIHALLDENNDWRTVSAQNGADGMTGVVIVEFRS